MKRGTLLRLGLVVSVALAAVFGLPGCGGDEVPREPPTAYLLIRPAIPTGQEAGARDVPKVETLRAAFDDIDGVSMVGDPHADRVVRVTLADHEEALYFTPALLNVLGFENWFLPQEGDAAASRTHTVVLRPFAYNEQVNAQELVTAIRRKLDGDDSGLRGIVERVPFLLVPEDQRLSPDEAVSWSDHIVDIEPASDPSILAVDVRLRSKRRHFWRVQWAAEQSGWDVVHAAYFSDLTLWQRWGMKLGDYLAAARFGRELGSIEDVLAQPRTGSGVQQKPPTDGSPPGAPDPGR